MSELNKYSKTITQDETQPAAQAMLHAIGLTKEDFKKHKLEFVPQVGMAIHVICI
jgi:dihydroxyacid dehydratase/phosphogluconate dehydratase